MNRIWPPNYTDIFIQRQKRYKQTLKNTLLIDGARRYYADKCTELINDWCITYDPRNTFKSKPQILPFILFPRQEEFVQFLLDCLENDEGGLVEKSRDMGATWLCCAVSVWLWLYKPGSSIGWGSRKEMLVDRLGDPDSIFEKMRMIIDYLPRWLLPTGFNKKEHLSYMKIINPENGATITGEAGDNIGRGGRKTLYFKDESAIYEHPESIEAALSENTNCQIDISTVHGTANVFHRRRMAGEEWEPGKRIPSGKTRVFIFDWRHHPEKDQAWYDKKRAKAEEEGLLHLFAQEVDRDPSAAVEGVVIPALWVKAAIDAHVKLNFSGRGMSTAAQDVADEGGDKNAFCNKKGVVIQYIESWAEGDVGETTNRAIMLARERDVRSLQYDCIGVGAGFKAESNRLIREGLLSDKLEIVPWNAAAAVLFPENHIIEGDRESPKNKDFYSNLKAQAWWQLRNRFWRTYKAVVQGVKHSEDELISIPSTLAKLHELVSELSQPTYAHDGRGKVKINKKPDGAKSPNLADSVVMVYWPAKAKKQAYMID